MGPTSQRRLPNSRTELSATTLTMLTDQDCGGVGVSPLANENVQAPAHDSTAIAGNFATSGCATREIQKTPNTVNAVAIHPLAP